MDEREMMLLWVEAAWLEAYTAWLQLTPLERQQYPMPVPSSELRR